MTFYSTWQEALMVFILMYGHNYKDSYNLMVEFENKLQKNAKGAFYFMQ